MASRHSFNHENQICTQKYILFAEIIGSHNYLTVYVAGFPEYFDFQYANAGDESYICLRWEKLTGRIDLAIDGKWVVGKNTCI